MNDMISVIIPIYNVEPYLRQCLDSVVNQTYKNLEIILVDDGSPDNCGAICDEYAARDERITVIHKENEGLSAARNDGMERATGEWIAFVDSDDWCELDYYEEMLRCPEAEKADVICANGCFTEHDNGQKTVSAEFKKAFFYERHEDMEKLMVKVLMHSYEGEIFYTNSGLGAPWDKLFSTAFLRRIGLRFDTFSKAWEDLWFVFQALDKAEYVVGVLYTGYHYRIVNTSITKGFNPQKPQINYSFLTKLYQYLGRRAKEPLMKEALGMRALMLIKNSCACYYFHQNYPGGAREKIKGLNEMTQWPYYHEALFSNDDSYLSLKNRVLKYGLRWRRGGYFCSHTEQRNCCRDRVSAGWLPLSCMGAFVI